MTFIFKTTDNLLMEPEHQQKQFFILKSTSINKLNSNILDITYTTLDNKYNYINAITKDNYAKDIIQVDIDNDLFTTLFKPNKNNP